MDRIPTPYNNKKRLGFGARLLIGSAVLLGIIITVLAIHSARIQRPIQEKRAMLQECKDYIQDGLPEDLKDCYKDFPVDGEFEITCTPKWETTFYQGYGGLYWTDILTVRLNTAESFDDLSERERNDLLKELKTIGTSNRRRLIIEHYPWYSDPQDLIEGAYEKTFFLGHKWEDEFSIKTPANRYVYVPESDGSKVNRPTPSPSPTPLPTPYPYAPYKPTQRPTNEPERTDPWEAHLFDDPDEYADYYAEDFADEYEEDIDDAYLDAYDHWVEWHEGY